MIQTLTMPKMKPVQIPVPPYDEAMKELAELERKEYRRVHEKLNLRIPLDPPTDTLNDIFLAWMKEQNLGIYDHEQVKKFLERQCFFEQRKWQKASIENRHRELNWVWRLLKQPAKPNLSFGGKYTNTHYTKPVPLPVLHLVEKIDTAFPDKATFFVSDYEVRNPDPFLMLQLVDNRFAWGHVVAHWDEPAFKGKAKK